MSCEPTRRETPRDCWRCPSRPSTSAGTRWEFGAQQVVCAGGRMISTVPARRASVPACSSIRLADCTSEDACATDVRAIAVRRQIQTAAPRCRRESSPGRRPAGGPGRAGPLEGLAIAVAGRVGAEAAAIDHSLGAPGVGQLADRPAPMSRCGSHVRGRECDESFMTVLSSFDQRSTTACSAGVP